MADRSITLRLGANVTGLVNGFRTATKAAEDFAAKGMDRIANNSQAVNTLSNTAGILGGAMVAGAGAAVLAFANFDEAMSSVQASTLESAENMELLREAALEAGARTAYSATEAAAGIEELAKAGVSTTDILNGGLDGALDLAAAGGIGVAEAAETAASAMTQFGLSGEEVTHIADLLAAGAGKAQGGVSDLGQALNQSGLVASQMGLDIEETVGSLTAFASAGLVGSDAGTSFRSMLLRLANPTKESAQLMEDLGIRVYDTSGEFVGMEGLAGQLQDRLGHLDQETRNAALAQIFGQDAIRTSAILYEEGAEGVREWTEAVDESGYAAEVAATRMDNLKGDWEEFTGALETALIGADEGADGALRSLVQGATEAVNWFSELPAAVQQGTVALTGAGGLVLLGVAGLGRMLTAASDVRDAIQNLGLGPAASRVGRLATSVGKFGAQATIGAAGAMAIGGGIKFLVDQARGIDRTVTGLEEMINLLQGASESGDYYAATLGRMAEEGQIAAWRFGDLGDAAEAVANQNWGDKLFGKLGIDADGISDATEEFRVMGEALASLPIDQAAEQFRGLWIEAGATDQAAQNLLESMPAFEESLYGVANEAGMAASEADILRMATGDLVPVVEESADAQESLGDATDDTTGSVEDQVAALAELIEMQAEIAGVALSQREAQRNLEAAYDDLTQSVKDNGNTFDITTEKGRANQSALDDIAGASWDLIEAMAANGASQEELQAKMEESREKFIRSAEGAGISRAAAEALADQLNLIPSAVETQVAVTGVDTALSRLASLDSTLNNINGKTVTASVAIRQYGQAAMATGGPVIGPGTGTSDSIPAMLSNGEHVLTAAEVAAAGGHGAIYALRSAIRSGAAKFAEGGAVQYVPSFASGGRVSASPAVVSLEGMTVAVRVGEREFTGYVQGISNGQIREREWQTRGVRR